ncbi:Mis12-Mtw1 protein family-domain-containing protein [Kockovaella imperatae]|uniref:Mis12-Mtw1 protein family-domain-containing protein n=1 Tax=Kockovaella imperatae TaxID=4999 RepID=A0A1Y1UJU4_9TREE|nr:Mis12-Mtw1 protein family-domain-containing protein [Kockovaella imperatae]ORX38323.1 Mis12-Mtw1 protein family-domain-containing protein [Kockovaella imperatae]
MPAGGAGGAATLESPSRHTRKRTEDVVFAKGDAKRRKKDMPSTMFKPQPILSNSSDTPPEDEEEQWSNIPPPPSERKIARRRPSMKQRVEDVPDESKIAPTQSKQSRSGEDLVKSLRADDNMASTGKGAGSWSGIQSMSFASSSRSQLPGHRPSSPPRERLGFVPRFSTALSSSTLQPPATKNAQTPGLMGPPSGPLRKTRKSLKGLAHGLPADQEEAHVSMTMALPDSETPMIRKNQEMREAQRRSSLGQRTQRASSSLGKGEITIPHSSVPTSMFYRHITPLIPEPIRARHLIAWCGKRAGDAEIAARLKKKRSGDSSSEQRTEDGDRILEGILEDFGLALGKGAIDTNVFAQKSAPPISSLAPHPRNVANREIRAKEEEVIQRCKTEIHLWDRLHKSAHNKAQRDHAELREKRIADVEPDVYTAEDEWMRDAIKMADRMIREGDGDLRNRGEFADVEFKVDTLLQDTHSALQYSRQAQRFLDGIFESLSADLKAKDGGSGVSAKSNLGTETVSSLLASSRSDAAADSSQNSNDAMAVLRAISKLEGSNPDPRVLAKAEQLESSAPAPSLLASSVGPGSKGWTPRRVTSGSTPRGAD